MKSDNDKIVPLIRIVDDDMDLLEGLAYMLEGEGWEVKNIRRQNLFLFWMILRDRVVLSWTI